MADAPPAALPRRAAARSSGSRRPRWWPSRRASRGWTLPALGLVLSAAACAVAALAASRVVVWYRHTTVACPNPHPVRRVPDSRAAAVPVGRLLRRGGDAVAHRDALRRRGRRALADAAGSAGDEARHEIDAMTALPALVTGDAAVAAGAQPTLISRFALEPARYSTPRTPIDVVGRALRRWREPRQTLAARTVPQYTRRSGRHGVGVRMGRVRRGGAVRLRRAAHAARRDEDLRAGDAGLAAECRSAGSSCTCCSTTGRCRSSRRRIRTSRCSGRPKRARRARARRAATSTWRSTAGVSAPVYSSGRAAWPISDALFARIYDPSRRPFWTTIDHGRRPLSRVLLERPRGFIYALGYPRAHAVRSPRPPRRADDAGRRAAYVVVLLVQRRRSPASRASARASAARCCGRFARASIGSCSWRSCWPRSSPS